MIAADPPTDSLKRQIRAACLMEVTAPKPGNVHPGAAFDDATYQDFITSANTIAPILARTGELGVGWAMLESVRATREAVGSNTNLGIIILLAPLAAVPLGRSLPTGIKDVLDRLTPDDARHCFTGIREASPGGLGTADLSDVRTAPTVGLVNAMHHAANRDLVAAQYANGFHEVFKFGLPRLVEIYDTCDWKTAIVRLHLELMASRSDTLIARKCGREVANESARRARRVLECGWPTATTGKREFQKFDAWLREDGHRRNPGTTADLIAAILFAALREGVIDVPTELAD